MIVIYLYLCYFLNEINLFYLYFSILLDFLGFENYFDLKLYLDCRKFYYLMIEIDYFDYKKKKVEFYIEFLEKSFDKVDYNLFYYCSVFIFNLLN